MKQFDKINLGLFPTPMYRLNNISELLGTNVWIKRDDMNGIALGGNKVRKLRYLLADAKNKGYDLVATTGGAQSNHAMLTAACCNKLGMEPILVLKKRGVTECKGNLILNKLMGTDVRFIDTDSYDYITGAVMDEVEKEKGRPLYRIPCGGSNAIGSLGYLDCIKEIAETGEKFDYIVTACGSGGTTAGTALGAKLYMPGTKVISPMVDEDDFDTIVHRLMEQVIDELELDIDIPEVDLFPMWGPGYAIPSEEGNEAISMLMKNEGIVIDTCYTGKAFAGLIKRAREGFFKPEDKVLFIHTGGAGGLFSQDWEHMSL